MEVTGNTQKYSLRWLGQQALFILIMSLVMTILTNGIGELAANRQFSGLLTDIKYGYISNSIIYCFAVFMITLMSLLLIEVAFRKGMSYLHYGLIEAALCLFTLLLLAMAEKMPFWVAYIVVSIMTIALISCYVMGITKTKKAVTLSTIILTVEYGLILLLVYIGSMALLVGSLLLFILIAVAMYFTLKLKVENEEIVLK